MKTQEVVELEKIDDHIRELVLVQKDTYILLREIHLTLKQRGQ